MKSAQRLALGCATALAIVSSAAAQGHDGDYAGVLKVPNGQQLHLVLHLKTTGPETDAVLDSVDQGASIPAAAVKVDGDKMSILFLSVGAEMEGAFAPDGKTFTGAFKQGLEMPLTLTRTEAAPAKP